MISFFFMSFSWIKSSQCICYFLQIHFFGLAWFILPFLFITSKNSVYDFGFMVGRVVVESSVAWHGKKPEFVTGPSEILWVYKGWNSLIACCYFLSILGVPVSPILVNQKL